MITRVPPRSAMWLLRQLGPRYGNEALSGDLFEEYQLNRTRAWYWRQVLAAIWVGRAMGARLLLGRLSLSGLGVVMPRLALILKRLMAVFTITALSAGTLTWAGGSSRMPQQRGFWSDTAMSDTATISSPAAAQRHGK